MSVPVCPRKFRVPSPRHPGSPGSPAGPEPGHSHWRPPTHGHGAHTAPSPARRLAARAGAEAEELPALPHCRSEAPAGSCSRVGCWGLCGVFFFRSFISPPGFGLTVRRVHPPLPTAGFGRANRAAPPRVWGRLSPETPGPPLCRAAAAQGFTCPSSPPGVRPRRCRWGGTRPRYLPPAGLKPLSPPLARRPRRAAPQEVPGQGRWRRCRVAGPGPRRAGTSPPSEKAGGGWSQPRRRKGANKPPSAPRRRMERGECARHRQSPGWRAGGADLPASGRGASARLCPAQAGAEVAKTRLKRLGF